MGMYGRLRQISEADLKKAKSDPDGFYSKFRDPGKAARLDEVATFMKESPIAKKMNEYIKLVKNKKVTMEEYAEVADVYKREFAKIMDAVRGKTDQVVSATGDLWNMNLEKSWHCLHFILTENVEPDPNKFSDSPVLGGHEIPDAKGVMGYGPIRYFESAQVKERFQFLKNFPIKEKIKRYDQEKAKVLNVYCPDHGPDELEHYFGLLLNFYNDVEAKKNSILLWIE